MKTLLSFFSVLLVNVISERSFVIDYENNTFLKDGQPFRYVSGSIHYFRVPREYWDDRLKKIRALGCNAIVTYLEWSGHEPKSGKYNFEGTYDIETFLKLAQANDLLVILRTSPYIDAERDFGGLPFWLLEENPAVELRTKDTYFMGRVKRWYDVILPKLKKYLYSNGGPIITVQIENEYGSYAAQTDYADKEYLVQLRDAVRERLGNDVVLFSTDGAGITYLTGGKTADVYATVDFGPDGKKGVEKNFGYQRVFEPRGPLVNSEFYPGWLDHWGQPHANTTSASVTSTLDDMLAMGANVNMYMVHGGTSFGFTAGANLNKPGQFEVCPTSYDYDAPISEAGDLTEKYEAIKGVIRKYLPIPSVNINATVPKSSYGGIELSPLTTLLEGHALLRDLTASARYPLTFEALGLSHGLVIYSTKITDRFMDPAELYAPNLHDRGYVFIDGEPKGILTRVNEMYSMPLSTRPGQTLTIIVENQGRVCYGPKLKDFKGLLSNVTLDGRVLEEWSMDGFGFDDLDHFVSKMRKARSNPEARSSLDAAILAARGSMSFWVAKFSLPAPCTAPNDTFLALPGWSKGIAFINNFNLGRYWPVVGPQETLYVPAPVLKCRDNLIAIFEQDRAPCVGGKKKCVVKFVEKPVINGPVPIQYP